MKTTSAAWVLMLSACSAATPEQQFVSDVARAIGGRDRVAQVTSFVVEGSGRATNLGQDMTWEATQQHFVLSDVRRVMDVPGQRARTTQTRTPAFLYFQGPQPQRQIVGFEGDVAYAITANGNATRQSAAVAKDRRAEFYHHPLTIVRAMLEPSARVAGVRAHDGGRRADITIGDITFTVDVDQTGVPTRVSSPGDHANLGDVTITTTFADYQPAAELTLPTRLATQIDERTTSELQVARYAFSAPPDDVAVPPAVASAVAPTPAAPVVEVTPVARGVWWLAGQTHHSALIEFADHLTLVEAPQGELRTLAVIAKARETVPGKPLSELVISHHHFDHSGGLRAAVAEGLAVVTHKGNAAFVEEMIKRPHRRQPDALQRTPRPLTLRTVENELTLQDSTMTVVLYALPGNPHAETMIMAYVPSSRLLIEADAFSPGGTYHPYAANLLETIRTRALRVERLVPLHGAIVSFDDLVKAVEAQGALQKPQDD